MRREGLRRTLLNCPTCCVSEALELLSIACTRLAGTGMFKDVQFPSPKAAANERKYPNILELAVGGNELDVTLGRQIINFHKSRHIQPHHGRTIIRQHHPFRDDVEGATNSRRILLSCRSWFAALRVRSSFSALPSARPPPIARGCSPSRAPPRTQYPRP